MHDTILDRLTDALTDFLAELRRLWRGPEPALGERANPANPANPVRIR